MCQFKTFSILDSWEHNKIYRYNYLVHLSKNYLQRNKTTCMFCCTITITKTRYNNCIVKLKTLVPKTLQVTFDQVLNSPKFIPLKEFGFSYKVTCVVFALDSLIYSYNLHSTSVNYYMYIYLICITVDLGFFLKSTE